MLAIAGPASAVQKGPRPGTAPPRHSIDNSPGTAAAVVMRLPLNRSGALIADDANTVAHVWFDGAQLRDVQGNAWTQNGTVPQSTTGAFTQSRGQAGPYTAANYYQLGTGNDALDFAGDFSVCAMFIATDITAAFAIVANGQSGVSGWALFSTAGGSASILTYDGTGNAAATVSQIVVGGPNIVCAGRTGSNMAIKLNMGTYTTAAAKPITVGTGQPARIGLHSSGSSPATAQVIEVWASSTTPSDALFTKIQQGVLGYYGTKGETITLTRSTPGTYTGSDGLLYTAPTAVMRVTTGGTLIEPAATNFITQSGDITAANWTKRGTATAVKDGTLCPDGITQAAKLTGLGAINVNDIFQTASGFTISAPISTSLWVKRIASTGTLGVVNAQTVANGRWDIDLSAIGLAWVRIQYGTQTGVTATTAWASTAGGAGGVQFVATAGTPDVYVCFVQQENGPVATSYIATAGTSASRSADIVSAPTPNGLVPTYCVGMTVTPIASWGAPAASSALWSIGAYAAANDSVTFISAGRVPTFQVRSVDGTTWEKAWSATAIANDFASHRFLACNSSGILGEWVDSLPSGALSTNVGPASPPTQPTPMYLGQSNGLFSAGVYIADVRVCKSTKRGDCQ